MTVSGNATVGGTLGVTGATALDGGLTMDTNKFTVADTSGNTTIAGTLGVTGVTTLTARSIHSGGITVANDGQIGSVGDADSMAIASGGVVTFTQIPVLPANTIDSDSYVDGSIDSVHIATNAIDATRLNVSGNGSSGYALVSDADGSFSWAAFSGSDTTYTQEWVDSSNDVILRLNPSAGGDDDLKMVAGTGITLTPSGDDMTIAATAGTPTVITVADESSDTTCFPAFFHCSNW